MTQPSLPGLDPPADIPPGKLGAIYEALPPGEQGPYLKHLRDRSVPAEKLVAALARLDQHVSASLIRTYRRQLAHEEAP